MTGKMVAFRKATASPGFVVESVPIPRIAADEVLVAVEAASVCGTDATIWKWKGWSRHRVKPPLTVGHELAGNVVYHDANRITFHRVKDFRKLSD